MTAIKYAAVKDVDTYRDQAIAAFAKGRTGLQKALVADLVHAGRSGNWKHFNQYLTDPRLTGLNKTGLVAWVMKFTGLEIVKEKVVNPDTGKEVNAERFGNFPGKGVINADVVAEAKATMFWDLGREPSFSGMNLSDEIRKLFKRAHGYAKKFEDGKITAEEYAQVNTQIDDGAFQLVAQHFEGEIVQPQQAH